MSSVKETKRGEKKGLKKDKTTLRRLKMYNSGRAKRDRKGNIISQEYQSKDTSHKAMVEPNRKWFGPVRTTTHEELNDFREELEKHSQQPNKVLLRASKIPYSLLRDPKKESKMHILEVESFESTFGKKNTRKRPRLNSYSLENFARDASEKGDGYEVSKDSNIKVEEDFRVDKNRDKNFTKGQSSRIWNELYKVVDSSDVLIQVLDARDPVGTRCKRVEKHIKENCPHKHIVLVLNKCDLIPTWATKRWLRILSREYPTLAFHASITKPFGKGSLIQLLRQFQHLHSDKQQISVGFIGYPNVGKSSIINALRRKKVCTVAPIPGETKVWQYITLFKKIFLIDCPGIVTPAPEESEIEIVLKGVIRVENLDDPSIYIPAILERAKTEYIQNTYNIMKWKDANDFLEQFAHKSGKLLKKAEPDISTASKMILHDWIRGKIPYYVSPPDDEKFVAKKSDDSNNNNEDEDQEDDENQSMEIPRQKLSGLRVRAEFKDEKKEGEEIDDDDVVGSAEEDDDEGEEKEGGDDGDEEANMSEDDVDNEDDELAWEHVMKNVKKSKSKSK
eukprot:TRINITY_DN8737_c0_g1_i1.p1 TRINITY_DN8737_c0_g1~~TRINITY_DN8737_c0_g1_i1.p1  ORF type:complete len:562 (-),score=170.88 TRINITY_DN8737_c0_g1_i1:18-1703(-)